MFHHKLYIVQRLAEFFDKDKTALSVLGAILGGGMSSRLFIEVRERRGLAYYVKAVSDLHHETGYFAARAGVNLGKTREAIKVILDEFAKVKKGEVKQQELDKAKEYLKGHIALDLEDSLEVAFWYGRRELLQSTTETPHQAFEKIDKVTLGDVKRVAERVFVPEKINLAVIGPFTNKDKFINLIS